MEKLIEINSKEYQISAKIYLPEEMIKNGIGVICFDFPGHGMSKTNGSKLTIDNCMQDINTVENYIKRICGNLPISIFATSFGAYITLINIAQNNKKYKNIILRSSAIRMANIYRYNLLREPEEVYKKRGYTKLGFEREIIIPYSFMKELDNNDIFAMYRNIEIPKIYIVQGDKDDVAPIHDTKEFVSLNPEKIKLYIIEGADHRMKGEGELEKAINFSKKIILGK